MKKKREQKKYAHSINCKLKNIKMSRAKQHSNGFSSVVFLNLDNMKCYTPPFQTLLALSSVFSRGFGPRKGHFIGAPRTVSK